MAARTPTVPKLSPRDHARMARQPKGTGGR
jgi:hypothetical protein